MNAVVKEITPGSPASGTIIAVGDVLRKINGHEIADVLDYRFLTYDALLMLELTGANGKLKLVRLSKPEGAEVGLVFDTFLMDEQRSCSNKCIFCFIDQLPRGMRDTLYYKDDDVRLSFLQGNYITLSNLSDKDIERIIKLRISPVNVSVHTLDPELRSYMMGNKKAAAGVTALKALADAGITLNCQIVCCPGVNDGANLSATLRGFVALGPAINSVSIVPVGLTKHREGLAQLRPFDKELSLKTVRQVGYIGEKCLKQRGSRVFYCADELYITAGLKLPPHEHYEDYPQLENGVGMMRLFIQQFAKQAKQMDRPLAWPVENVVIAASEPQSHAHNALPQFSIVTGAAAFKYLTNLLKIFTNNCDRMIGRVYAIRNDFFGDSVTVSGLITGRDIIAQLRGHDLGERLLIPENMLRHGDDVFLDDVTVSDVSEALGVPVRVVRQDGADLYRAIVSE